MKHFLPAFLFLISNFCFSQKYVLIDKRMALPISYTNIVTLEHSYKNLFAVEKEKIHQFIAEVEKIAVMLSDKNKAKPEAFDFYVGKTRFTGLKVPLSVEERLDVVLCSDFDGTKVNMHLSDAKSSNASNAFYVNTWLKYIKSNVR
ncbi:MAG: hypothetical protein JWN83_287 [Chitinophagaceae bacterium]|nr:hypothetical protein [Chitinophagaceae bacterium]